MRRAADLVFGIKSNYSQFEAGQRIEVKGFVNAILDQRRGVDFAVDRPNKTNYGVSSISALLIS